MASPNMKFLILSWRGPFVCSVICITLAALWLRSFLNYDLLFCFWIWKYLKAFLGHNPEAPLGWQKFLAPGELQMFCKVHLCHPDEGRPMQGLAPASLHHHGPWDRVSCAGQHRDLGEHGEGREGRRWTVLGVGS